MVSLVQTFSFSLACLRTQKRRDCRQCLYFSVFQYSLTGKNGFGSGFGSGVFAKMYASLGCGALRAQCTAGPNILGIFCFLARHARLCRNPPLLKPLFLVPESIQIFLENKAKGIGPYNVALRLTWTNGSQISQRVLVYTGIGP